MAESLDTILDADATTQHLQLAPGMTVGDFGVGGAAYFALALSRLVGTQGHVVMFDVVKASLSSALSNAQARGAQNCHGVWCDLEVYGSAKGVPDGSLDAGVIVNVLHQTDRLRDMLTEIHRMLKSGAKLLVVDWQPNAEHPLAPNAKHRLASAHVAQEAHDLGFAAFEQFAASPYHWGLVIVKT